MMMSKASLLVLALLACASPVLLGQSVKSEPVEYRYIQLPTEPVSGVTNYQATIIAEYEKQNEVLKAKYQQDLSDAQAEFEAKQASYPQDVKAAEEQYAKEMEVWSHNQSASVLTDERGRNAPIKQLPPTPYLRYVAEPKLQRSYDYAALASTYLAVEGFENKPENAVNVIVTLFGFDYTQPRQITEVRQVVAVKDGQSVTSNVNYYHTEFTYRHTMSVRVTDPSGKELFYLTPEELNNYSKYESPVSQTPGDVNEAQLLVSHEEKIVQKNLTLIGNLVNDRIGFRRQTRTTELYYVKDKKGIYADVLVPFNETTAGLKQLVEDEASARETLRGAAAKFMTVLAESDINDKKARIDLDITIALHFNLLECYLAVHDFEKADQSIDALNSLPISKSQREQKDQLETLLAEFKKRAKANR